MVGLIQVAIAVAVLGIVIQTEFRTKMSCRHKLWRKGNAVGTVFAPGKFSPNYLNYGRAFVS